MKPRSRFALLLSALVAGGGCSLFHLDDIHLPPCADDRECDVLNAHAGLPDTCFAHRCVEGDCLPFAAGQEAHDGLDNDCDGLIDEPSIAADGQLSQTITASPSIAAADIADETSVTFATDGGGDAAAAWWGGDGAAWYAPVEVGLSSAEPMSYLRGEDESSLNDLDLVEGCFGLVDGAPYPLDNCDFGSVAFDLHAESSLVAAISTAGCRGGQLRIGTFPRGAAPEVELRGPLRRSNTYLGVDLNGNGQCSGGSQPECGDENIGCGVTAPVVTILEGAPTQALVGYIGAGLDRAFCGEDAADVDVLAVALMRGQRGVEPFSWIVASDESRPLVLGQTLAAGPPAIMAWSSTGYLVASSERLLGDERDRLAFDWIEAFEPPEDDGLSCVDDPCDVDQRPPSLHTGPLETEDLAQLDGAGFGPIDHIALARGRSTNDRLDLGVAWREGCDDDQAIYFRRLDLRVASGRPVSAEPLDEPIRLDVHRDGNANRRSAPALLFVEAGFVVEGFTRGDQIAGVDERGGWWVLWLERSPSRIAARRIAALDGRPVDEEPLDLSPEGARPRVGERPPALFLRDDVPTVAFHDRNEQQLLRLELAP